MPVAEFAGRYFDGRKAKPAEVSATIDGTELSLDPANGDAVLRWPVARIRAQRDRGSAKMRLFFLAGEDARLQVDEPQAQVLARHCPNLYKRVPNRRAARRAAVLGAGAVAAVTVLLLLVVPMLANRLAVLIPPEREAALGRMVEEQAAAIFTKEGEETTVCENPEGVAALGRMFGRLTDAGPVPYDLTFSVLKSEEVNAFAAPGGRMVVLSGLIDAAQSPDEVAGVLAHELGHVAHRDPTRLMLRTAGSAGLLGLLFGDFTGGAILVGVSNRLLQASYTRDAEAGADAYAFDALEKAGVSTEGLAQFFERLSGEEGATPGALVWFQSHPALEGRARNARARDVGAAGTPILSGDEWAALKSVCN